MSRRDQWKKVQNGMFGEATKARSVEEREKIPEVACGICRNFSENAYASDGRGTCRILKTGSSIADNDPAYVTEGEVGFVTFFNTDGSKCSYFARMDLIDRDGAECADPAYRRMQRQMEKLDK